MHGETVKMKSKTVCLKWSTKLHKS